MAVALDPRADERRPWRPPGHDRGEMADRDARDGRRPDRGDRTAIEDRGRGTRRGVIDDDQSADRRQSALVVGREPRHPLDPDQVACSTRVGAAQIRRHGVDERVRRSRVDADLRRQLGVGDEGDHRLLGQGRGARRCRAWRRGHRRPRGSGAGDRTSTRVTRSGVYASAMAYDGPVPPIDVEQSLDNLKLERDAIVLYDALSAIEKDPRRAAAFERIAGNERRHADIWASKLRDLGADVPAPDGPRVRVRFIILAARLLGTAAVADLVKALEGDEEAAYGAQAPSPEVAAIAADEREHAVIWDRLKGGTVDPEAIDTSRDGVAIARGAHTAAELGQHERWHRAGGTVGDPSSRHLRGQRRPGQQPFAGHGRGRRLSGQPELHHPGRDRRAAGRGVQHGRRRVHLDAEPARAVRAPDRPRARRDGGDARGRGGRTGASLPGKGLQPGRSHPHRAPDLPGP